MAVPHRAGRAAGHAHGRGGVCERGADGAHPQGPVAGTGHERGDAAGNRGSQPGDAGHPSRLRISDWRRGGDGLRGRRGVARRCGLRYQLRGAPGADHAGGRRGTSEAARTGRPDFPGCAVRRRTSGIHQDRRAGSGARAGAGRGLDGGERVRRGSRCAVRGGGRRAGRCGCGGGFGAREGAGLAAVGHAGQRESLPGSAVCGGDPRRSRGARVWHRGGAGGGADSFRLARAGPPSVHGLCGRDEQSDAEARHHAARPAACVLPDPRAGRAGVPGGHVRSGQFRVGEPAGAHALPARGVPAGLRRRRAAGFDLRRVPQHRQARVLRGGGAQARPASASEGRHARVPGGLAITTTSPLPTGQVGVNYSQTLTAIGGSGLYTWAVSVGSSLPGGLLLNSVTGLISGPPTTAAASNFTIQATASQAFALTINPAASIQTLSPSSANAGLSLQVSITGSYTHFVQGTTVASFGPGIAVGGAAAGQPGPVTVASPTSATAEIAIGASAATGSQTVAVTTGAEQATLANGFTIQAAIPYISLTTTSTTPLAQGLSGFNDAYLEHGIEYWAPKWLAAVSPLKPGWIRFPAGTLSMAFDWQAAHMNTTWMSELKPNMPAALYNGLTLGQGIAQGKGGACFSGGSCVSDYATFLRTLGANGIVSFNGFTDTNPDSAGIMVAAAQAAGLNIVEWEIDNEPYVFPKIFPTAASYAAAAYNPYYLNINAANPNATAGVFYQGQYLALGNYQVWDAGMAAYSPQYWQGVSFHVYPITNSAMSPSDEEMTLNGILAHGTTDWYSSTIQPLIGQNTPV